MTINYSLLLEKNLVKTGIKCYTQLNRKKTV